MGDLPPRDTWVMLERSLTRWRPQIDVIGVRAAPDGKVLRICLGGLEREIEITAQQAAHLAGLLLKS
jgi:hypothetical protein